MVTYLKQLSKRLRDYRAQKIPLVVPFMWKCQFYEVGNTQLENIYDFYIVFYIFHGLLF